MAQTFHCHDCNKDYPVKHDGGTGYANVRDAIGGEAKVCYACAAIRTKQDLIRDGKGLLYHSWLTGSLHGYVGDWSGELKFPVLSSRKSRHNIGDWQTHVYFKGPDGLWWHGKQIGEENTVCHVHRLARQDRRYA